MKAPTSARPRERLPGRYAAGRYYALTQSGYPETAAWEQGWASYGAFYSYGLTIDRVGLRVAVAGEPGAVMRIGIYRNAADLDLPDALLIDAGTVAADTTGLREIALAAPLRIPDGLSWSCFVPQLCPTTKPAFTGVAAVIPLTSQGSMPNPAVLNAYASAIGDVPGPLPATAIVATRDMQAPLLIARAA